MFDSHKKENYLDRIVKEQFVLESHVHIQTGKTPSENMNYSLLPKLSQAAKEYGFEIKLISMICSLDVVNENIIFANNIWNMINNKDIQTLLFSTYYFTKLNRTLDHIVYDIRHFVDQAISIVWILSQPNPVTRIMVDSIGSYLNDSNFTPFDKYIPFLQQLNDISNAYKHSIPNDMLMVLGKNEPCIYALDANHNKDIFHPQMYGISLSELVVSFNSFYKRFFEIMEQLNHSTDS